MNEKQLNALFERGNNFVRMGNLKQAIKDYDQVIAHQPQFAPAYFNRAFARQHGQQDVVGAIADYTQAIQLNPQFAQAFANRAIAHQQQHDLEAALADYTAALRLDPRLAQVYNNRAEIYFLQGDYAAARADFEQAHQLKAGYTYAIAGLAITQHALGQVEAAHTLWKTLQGMNAHFADLAWLTREMGWADPLIAEAQKLLESM